MLYVDNESPFETGSSIQKDKDGNQHWIVLVKGTYLIGKNSKLKLSPEPEPVCLTPIYFGEPGKSSLKRDCEAVIDHPGTDVTLNGTAYVPGSKPKNQLNVELKVGGLVSTLKIFGQRYWKRGAISMKPSKPEPFLDMKIRYENAYGGSDITNGEKVVYDANPVGKGFYTQRPASGSPLPCIEIPSPRIAFGASWKHRATPAGFGAIDASWSPRREYAGTFDKEWQLKKMPLWPDDYDPRHALSAQPDLISKESLKGGEPVKLVNLAPESELMFNLPEADIRMETRIKGKWIKSAVNLDRVIIEPDDRTVIMVWRSALNCGPDARQVEKTLIYLEE